MLRMRNVAQGSALGDQVWFWEVTNQTADIAKAFAVTNLEKIALSELGLTLFNLTGSSPTVDLAFRAVHGLTINPEDTGAVDVSELVRWPSGYQIVDETAMAVIWRPDPEDGDYVWDVERLKGVDADIVATNSVTGDSMAVFQVLLDLGGTVTDLDCRFWIKYKPFHALDL